MKIQKKTLANGLRVIFVPMKENETVTVLLLVGTGSHYETKEINGIAHFLEHMYFKGTHKRPSAFHITEELEALGAYANAFTTEECTGYYAKSDKKHFTKILDVISDIYHNSTIPEAELSKEKGVIVEEINMYEDMPDQKVDWLFTKLLYGDTPLGRPVIGNKENVLSFTRNDFLEFQKKFYTRDNTVLVVSGNIESSAQKYITEAFKSVSTNKKPKVSRILVTQQKPQSIVYTKDIDQSHIVLGVRAFKRGAKENGTLSVLACILGGGMSSRLFQLLREELGVAYYVRAYTDSSRDYGAFKISAGVTTHRTKEVVERILSECTKLTREYVTDKELQKAKDFMIGMMKLSLESSDSYAEFFGIQEITKGSIESVSEREKRIRSVTKEDVMKVAKKIFVDKGLNFALVGKDAKDTEIKKILRFKG